VSRLLRCPLYQDFFTVSVFLATGAGFPTGCGAVIIFFVIVIVAPGCALDLSFVIIVLMVTPLLTGAFGFGVAFTSRIL